MVLRCWNRRRHEKNSVEKVYVQPKERFPNHKLDKKDPQAQWYTNDLVVLQTSAAGAARKVVSRLKRQRDHLSIVGNVQERMEFDSICFSARSKKGSSSHALV